jgi:hypothetical protein
MNRVHTSIALVATMAAASASRVVAQVGYTPVRSPYIDLSYAQEFTFIGGVYHAHRDAANVGPQSGSITGVHYEWRAGGPLHLTGEIAYISSDRRLINPFRAEPGRELGKTSRPLYTADVGLGMSLTGDKSWHRLVPEIGTGIGLISDFRSLPDTGGFAFGTRFSFNLSAGIRYVPGGRWQVRLDGKDRLYTLAYPQTYFTAPTGGTAVVASTQSRSFWLNNPALTLGLSYLF